MTTNPNPGTMTGSTSVRIGMASAATLKVFVAGVDRIASLRSDDEGSVRFHSDPQHSLSEDFFIEADNNRRLRALVAARGTEWLDLSRSGPHSWLRCSSSHCCGWSAGRTGQPGEPYSCC